MAQAKFAPKVVRQVTLPLIKKADGVPLYVKFDSAIFTGKEIKGTGEKAKMEPARLANVTNLETGELGQIICNKVLEGTLTEEYPDNGYVNKGFAITQHGKASGKRYHTYTIAEIEV